MTVAVFGNAKKGTRNSIVIRPKNQSRTRQTSRLNPFLVICYRGFLCFPNCCERVMCDVIQSLPSRYVHTPKTKAARFVRNACTSLPSNGVKSREYRCFKIYFVLRYKAVRTSVSKTCFSTKAVNTRSIA